MSLNDSFDLVGRPGLQPCKIRRNYLCKDCDYATTNPREYLYHQRDVHCHKGSIHECPHCVYASPHSHKLNRHVTIIHSSNRSVLNRSRSQVVGSSGDGRRRTAVVPVRSFSSCSSPPPLVCHRRSASKSSPALEVVLLQDDDDDNDDPTTTRSRFKGRVRRLFMAPAAALFTTIPMPKLVHHRKPAERKPSSRLRSNALVRPTRLLQAPSLSQKSAKASSVCKWYSCSLCPFRSKSTIVIRQHEKAFHVKKRRKFIRCSLCNYVTNVRLRYARHFRLCHRVPDIKCNLCEFSTPYKWNLDRHQRYHRGSSGTGTAIRSRSRSRSRSSDRDVSIGNRRISSIDATSRRGQQPLASKDNGDADDAVVLHLADDEVDVVEGDSVSNGLPDSQATALSQAKIQCADPAVTCSECEDRFSSVALLDRHMYECHDIDNPRIPKRRFNPNASGKLNDSRNVVQCDLCSYKAKWVSEMVKHRRVHTLVKPYACARCKFRTRWKGDMTRHVMRYHGGGGNGNGDVDVDAVAAAAAEADAYANKCEPEVQPATESIFDCLLDQSMTVGCEGELDIYGSDRQAQANPLELSQDGAEGDVGVGGSGEAAAAADANKTSSYRDETPDSSFRLSGGKVVHKKYQCPHCNFVTPIPSRFHMHIVAHINPKPFMCSECGYRSNWQWDITKHSKMKAIRDRAHLSASVVCVNEYGSTNYDRYEQYAVYEMDNAVSSADDGGGNRLPSSASQVAAMSADSMVARRITYKCKHCDYKNPVKKMVVRHMFIHSGNKQKRFCCGICGRVSAWKHIILRHCHHVHGTSGPILMQDSPLSSSALDDVSTAGLKSQEDDMINTRKQQEQQQKSVGLHGFTKGDENGAIPGKEKRHKCSICPYQCRKVFDLRIHSYLHRPREGAIFKCLFCPFFVSLKRSWLNHMRLHVDRPQDYAKHVFNDGSQSDLPANDELMADMDDTTATADSTDIHTGGGSTVVTDSREGIPRVWVSRGGGVQKMYKCRHCPHVSKKRSVIMTHERMHRKRNIDVGKATYKCPHCNYTSKNAGVLTSHQKVHQQEGTVHSIVKRKMDADLEDTRSETFSSAKMHASPATRSSLMSDRLSMAFRPNDEDFPEGSSACASASASASASSSSEVAVKGYHLCGECPAKFTKLRQMLTHRTFHGAALPWQCDKCSYAAKHRPHLHRHERVHTAEYAQGFASSEELPPTAKPVDLAIAATENNVASVSSASSANLARPFERKYRCQMCPAIFLKYSTLVYHMHLHNNNGKYQCTHCTYSVSNLGNLARHAKIHEYNMSSSSSSFDDCNSMDSSQPYEAGCSSEDSSVPAATANRTFKRPKGRFACSKCPAVFDKLVRFNVHVNLHGSAHRFQCDKCDYAVKFAAILVRHRALHDVVQFGEAPDSSSALVDSIDLSLSENDNDPALGAFNDSNLMTPLESVDSPFSNDNDETPVETQQLILKTILSKPKVDGDPYEKAEVKKLFCCDRCPYVHQRKDTVQSHMKRHASTVPDSSFCPHCDYGTNIHSFLREHEKLHFKPSVLHKPDAFVRWEEFKVWAQSNVLKTLVYEHQSYKSEFRDEDVIEVSMPELMENLKAEEEAKVIKAIVCDILSEVESQARDNLPRGMSVCARKSPLGSCSIPDEKKRTFVDTTTENHRNSSEVSDSISATTSRGSSEFLAEEVVKEKSDFLEFALCLGYSA